MHTKQVNREKMSCHKIKVILRININIKKLPYMTFHKYKKFTLFK